MLTGAFPGVHAIVGPDLGVGFAVAVHGDVPGGIGLDQPFFDGEVERGAQRGAQVLQGRR
jgi:hypothetical protein